MKKNVLLVLLGTLLMFSIICLFQLLASGNGEPSAVDLDTKVKSVGPYSQVIRAGDNLYCSAQVAFVPDTDELVAGGITEQTRQIMDNFQTELREAGANLKDVVKVTVYLTDTEDFTAMNEVYATYFTGHYPVRTCVAVEAIPVEGALLSMDMVAYSPKR